MKASGIHRSVNSVALAATRSRRANAPARAFLVDGARDSAVGINCGKPYHGYGIGELDGAESGNMDDHFFVTCPYCGEDVEIYIEPDVRGSFVQDCEVCCNPWRVQVRQAGGDRYVELRRADGSE
jgi:hypothetical protein